MFRRKPSRSSQLTDSLAASGALLVQINRDFKEISSSHIHGSVFAEANQARPRMRTNLQGLSQSPNSTNEGKQGRKERSRLGGSFQYLGFKLNDKSSQTLEGNDDKTDTLFDGEQTVPVSRNVRGSGPNVVNSKSAAQNLPGVTQVWIQADLGHLCKFDNANSPGYEAVAGTICQYSERAPKITKDRWVDEGRIHALGVLKGELYSMSTHKSSILYQRVIRTTQLMAEYVITLWWILLISFTIRGSRDLSRYRLCAFKKPQLSVPPRENWSGE